jgi:hypothetical protein
MNKEKKREVTSKEVLRWDKNIKSLECFTAGQEESKTLIQIKCNIYQIF